MCHFVLNECGLQCSLIAAGSANSVWTPLRWLSATVSSGRATSSLSGAGGNLLHISNWTKFLSNSEPSYTHIRLSSRPGVNRCFSLVLFLLVLCSRLYFSLLTFCLSLCAQISDSVSSFHSLLPSGSRHTKE